jgi:hypothetical protein
MFNLQDVDAESSGYKPLTAGVNIAAVLSNVEFRKDKDGNPTKDLSLIFKGTDPSNQGDFTFIIWENTFNDTDQYYSVDTVKRTIAQIKHILAAYMDEDVVLKVQGKNWVEFGTNIMKALTKFALNYPCKLKIVLNNKDMNTFPLFPDFIVTDKTPNRVLRLNLKVNPKTGLFYERTIPMPVSQTPAVNLSTNSAPEQAFNLAGIPPQPAMDDLPF